MKIANPAQLFSFVANDKNKFPLTAIEGSVARGFKVNETELFPWLMKFQQWLFDFNEAESNNESPTAAGDGKEDVVAFGDWAIENNWVIGYNNLWWLDDGTYKGTGITTAQLYDIFKNRNK